MLNWHNYNESLVRRGEYYSFCLIIRVYINRDKYSQTDNVLFDTIPGMVFNPSIKAITRNYSEVENEQLEIKVGAEHGKIPS